MRLSVSDIDNFARRCGNRAYRGMLCALVLCHARILHSQGGSEDEMWVLQRWVRPIWDPRYAAEDEFIG